METFCKNLKHQADKIINYKKNEMIPLTDEETKSYENENVVYPKKNLMRMRMMRMNSNYTAKSEIIVITQENLEEVHITFLI